MEKIRIKEVIVVEGRDDEAAVLRAADAATIATHGYGIRQETLALIEKAYKRQGIIIFTDPDHAGETIRKRLAGLFPEAKHAFLARGEATKDGDIGIENASPAAILAALSSARSEIAGAKRPIETETAAVTGSSQETGPSVSRTTAFDAGILDELGLTGSPGSTERRAALGSLLGIGECNASQFIKRLNRFGISREELEAACARIKA